MNIYVYIHINTRTNIYVPDFDFLKLKDNFEKKMKWVCLLVHFKICFIHGIVLTLQKMLSCDKYIK